jgi:hypothetical protein
MAASKATFPGVFWFFASRSGQMKKNINNMELASRGASCFVLFSDWLTMTTLMCLLLKLLFPFSLTSQLVASHDFLLMDTRKASVRDEGASDRKRTCHGREREMRLAAG